MSSPTINPELETTDRYPLSSGATVNIEVRAGLAPPGAPGGTPASPTPGGACSPGLPGPETRPSRLHVHGLWLSSSVSVPKGPSSYQDTRIGCGAHPGPGDLVRP